MFTPDEIKVIEKLAEKNEVVKKLYEQWSEFYLSPYFKTYITLYRQIEDWNDQLTIKKGTEVERIYNEGKESERRETHIHGKIDLFGSKDDKEFERAFKYFSDVITILNTLDNIREKISPEEAEKLDAGMSYLDRTADKRKSKIS